MFGCVGVWSYQCMVVVCEVGLGEGLGSGKAGGWACEVGLGEGQGSGALLSVGLS